MYCVKRSVCNCLLIMKMIMKCKGFKENFFVVSISIIIVCVKKEIAKVLLLIQGLECKNQSNNNIRAKVQWHSNRFMCIKKEWKKYMLSCCWW